LRQLFQPKKVVKKVVKVVRKNPWGRPLVFPMGQTAAFHQQSAGPALPVRGATECCFRYQFAAVKRAFPG